jgi:hypothetical protein
MEEGRVKRLQIMMTFVETWFWVAPAVEDAAGFVELRA